MVIAIALLLLITFTSCAKPTESAAQPDANDETWYICGEYQILMLCGPKEGGFREIAEGLGGPGNKVLEAVETLAAMERTAQNLNALGVGYVLCGDLDAAEETLGDALGLSNDKQVRACIENNLAISHYERRDEVTTLEYLNQSLEDVGEDPIRRLTI